MTIKEIDNEISKLKRLRNELEKQERKEFQKTLKIMLVDALKSTDIHMQKSLMFHKNNIYNLM